VKIQCRRDFDPQLPAHIRREALCITYQTAQIVSSLTTTSAPAQRLAMTIATRREERATPFTVRIVDRHGRPHPNPPMVFLDRPHAIMAHRREVGGLSLGNVMGHQLRQRLSRTTSTESTS